MPTHLITELCASVPSPRVTALAGVLALALAASAAEAVEPISVHGSTTFNSRLIEPHRGLIEQRSGQRLDIIPSKSIHGLMALLEGRARLAMISSSLDGEVAHLKAKRPDLPIDRLVGFEIARTRVAFVLHPSNPVRRMSLDQVAAVLRGGVTGWGELGGPDLPITVVTVQPGGGVPTTVRGQLLGGKAFTAPRIVEVEAPRHVVQVTRQLEGAIGLTQLGLARAAPLPELQLEGRIEQELNLVALGEPAADLRAVIEAARAVAAEHLK